MRVTHVYKDSYPPVYGGIEQHIHTLTHQLKPDVCSEVLVSGKIGANSDDEGVCRRTVGEWGRFQGAPLSPRLPGSLRTCKSDLLHFHMPNPTGELSYLLSGSRVPAIATYHSDIVRQATALRFYLPFLHRFLQRLKWIIVATPYHISSSPILPEYRAKCKIIPYGIDVRKFAGTQAVRDRASQLRERYGKRLVLFVGKFRYYKGLEYLIRAMARIQGRLLLVGEGYEEPQLRALADELGLGDRVVWLSHLERDDFLGTLHACDVFCLPSIERSEAFGIAQLEAQACGKPVVSTALGTGVEYVNLHERTGLVVPPRDVEALTAALDRLLTNDDERLLLGEAARLRVNSEFTRERMAADTLAVYRDAAGVNPTREIGR